MGASAVTTGVIKKISLWGTQDLHLQITGKTAALLALNVLLGAISGCKIDSGPREVNGQFVTLGRGHARIILGFPVKIKLAAAGSIVIVGVCHGVG